MCVQIQNGRMDFLNLHDEFYNMRSSTKRVVFMSTTFEKNTVYISFLNLKTKQT